MLETNMSSKDKRLYVNFKVGNFINERIYLTILKTSRAVIPAWTAGNQLPWMAISSINKLAI
jgi:hypothetical protein